jgi:hypothetical protein
VPAFFVPHTKDRDQAEQVWERTRSSLEKQGFQTSTRRIYSIEHLHERRRYTHTVGLVDPMQGEEVMILLEAPNLFLCCTATRGILRGGPILIARSDPGLRVREFDPDA